MSSLRPTRRRGVIFDILNRFGFYYVLPLTAPQIISRPDATIPATTLTSSRGLFDICTITFGDYNVGITYFFDQVPRLISSSGGKPDAQVGPLADDRVAHRQLPEDPRYHVPSRDPGQLRRN